ncbi:MAG: hypothetical protein WAV20_03885 [Blastocatellia bacterium]
MKRTVTVVLLLVLAGGCSTKESASNNSNGNSNASQPGASAETAQPAAHPARDPSNLREGEASGTIIDEGQPIQLRYAYAGWGEQFDEEAVVLLLTDNPIPAERLARGFDESFRIFSDDIRGLEYKIGKGFWVRYRPSQFQTSGINTLKDYSVENNIVRSRDEDRTTFDGHEYKRSVSFIARLPEKK